jgi:uncharacterized protein (DUF849 family)
MTDSKTGAGRTTETKVVGGDAVVITCAVTGSIHTPTMSPYLPVTPTRSPERRSARPRRVRRSSTCTPATRRPASPDQTPAPSRVPAAHQAADQRVMNITTGGSPYDARRGAAAAGGVLQARGRLAQHGLDELRPLPPRAEVQGVQVRLGEAAISRATRTASSATPSRTSSTSSRPATATARASSSSATTSRTSTRSRTSSTGAW